MNIGYSSPVTRVRFVYSTSLARENLICVHGTPRTASTDRSCNFVCWCLYALIKTSLSLVGEEPEDLMRHAGTRVFFPYTSHPMFPRGREAVNSFPELKLTGRAISNVHVTQPATQKESSVAAGYRSAK
jgi:hypothetical protein